MVGAIRFPSLSLERKEHKKVGRKETVRSGVMWLRVLFSGICERRNEPACSIRETEFLDFLCDY
jgi:hypothetical protein